MNDTHHRPPIGVVPRFIWEKQIYDLHAKERKKALAEAIKHYANDGTVPIKLDWVVEYNEIIDRESVATPQGEK